MRLFDILAIVLQGRFLSTSPERVMSVRELEHLLDTEGMFEPQRIRQSNSPSIRGQDSRSQERRPDSRSGHVVPTMGPRTPYRNVPISELVFGSGSDHLRRATHKENKNAAHSSSSYGNVPEPVFDSSRASRATEKRNQKAVRTSSSNASASGFVRTSMNSPERILSMSELERLFHEEGMFGNYLVDSTTPSPRVHLVGTRHQVSGKMRAVARKRGSPREARQAALALREVVVRCSKDISWKGDHASTNSIIENCKKAAPHMQVTQSYWRGLVAEVRRYLPGFTVEEASQISLWVRRSMTQREVIREFRKMFQNSRVSDEEIGAQYNRFSRPSVRRH